VTKQNHHKTGIRRKITLLIVLSAFIVAVIGISIGYFWGFDLLRDTIGSEHVEMARLISVAMNRIIDEEIRDLKIYMSHPLRIKAAKERLSEHYGMDNEELKNYFQKMDSVWKDAPDGGSVIREFLSTPTSKRLKRLVEVDTGIAEILMTDNLGCLIAASGRTSDFYQADERWWKLSFNNGDGKTFIGDVGLDRSTNVLSVPIAVPIIDTSGKTIGVSKAVLDIDRLFAPLKAFKTGETGHAVLIDKEGYILFHENVEPLSAKFANDEDLRKLSESKKQWAILDNSYIHKEKLFMSYDLIEHPGLLNEGITWRVCISQNVDEVFTPLNRLFFQLIIVLVVMLIALILLGVISGGIFVAPITKLHEATDKVAKGDLDYRVEIKTGDELEQFADSFNIMTDSLKKTTTSVEDLNKEIDERKKIEEELRKVNGFDEALLSTIPFGMDIVDEDGNIVFMNKKMEEAVGEDWKGKKCWEVYRDNKKQCNACPLVKGIDVGSTATIETDKVCDGKIFQIAHTGMIYGGKKAILEIFINITDRKKAEEKLQESEEKYRTLYESSKDAIMTLIPGKRFISGNTATMEMFKCRDEQEFISKAPADLSPKYQGDGALSSTKSQEMMAQAMKKGSHFFEWTHKRLNGEEFFATVLLTKTKLKGQEILQATVRDITEQKKAEKALQETKHELEKQAWGLEKTNESIKLLYKELEEKNKELQKLDQLKSDFVSTVSHELRTPLTTMKEFVSIISDEIPGKLNKEQREYVDIVKSNIDRLARLINDLLDISRIEAGKIVLKKALINMKNLADEAILSLKPEADKKHIEIKVSSAKAISDVYVDHDRIIQVFTNLIGNAIKFTPDKGLITVEIKNVGDEVECSVIDTGIGIAPEHIGKVFDKFQQIGRLAGPGPKGTGLGLAITKELIQMHHGRIWVKSELGKGSRFIFILPKYSTESLFREYVSAGIKEVVEKDSRLSIVTISIKEFDKLKKELSKEEIGEILKGMESVLKNSLRRSGDVVIKDTGEVIVLLVDCTKESALRVEGRLEQALADYLAKKKIVKKIKLQIGCATYPDEAKDDEELIRKARVS